MPNFAHTAEIFVNTVGSQCVLKVFNPPIVIVWFLFRFVGLATPSTCLSFAIHAHTPVSDILEGCVLVGPKLTP